MYRFTQAQFTLIEQTATDPNPPGGNALANMYDLIYQIIQQPDAFGNIADSNVIAWFGAAAQANRGEGGASDLIRSYTYAQLVLRTGNEIEDISDVLQNASDEIANAVYNDIKLSEDVIDGEVYYTLPTAHQIGEKDAAKTLEQLAMFSSAPGIWSGNPLFIGLGDSSFWQDTILGDTSDTYDLAVSIKALIYSGISGIQNMTDLVSLWWEQGDEGRDLALQQVTQAISSTDTFLQNAYGQFGGNLINLSGSMLVIGSEDDDINLDQGTGLTANALIHSGSGNDFLYGSNGSDTIDGGSGKDYVSFDSGSRSGEYSNLTASIFNVQSDADFSAFVEGEGTSSAVFNAEDLTLGMYDDTLAIYSLAEGATSLSLVSGGDHGEKGDMIDLSELTSNTGAVITLQDEEGGAGSIRVDLSQIAVDSFENVIGSGKNDSIKGSAEANVIQGDGGDDTIDGGGGADLLAGGAGADTFNVNLSGASGPVILWGGEGADTFNFSRDPEGEWSPLRILTVNVTNLSEENFATIDLNMLGMAEGFDWSKVDAVIINPDSSDKVVLDGMQQGTRSVTFTPTISVFQDPNTWYGSEDSVSQDFTGTPIDFDTAAFDSDFSHLSVSDAFFARVARYYETSLFGDNMQVYTAAASYGVVSTHDLDGATAEDWDFLWEEEFDYTTADFTGTGYVEDAQHGTVYAWVRISGPGYTENNGAESFSQLGVIDDPMWLGDWAIIGGRFDGTQLVATHSVTLPGNEEALLS